MPFPSRSPYASVSQWVGLTNITVRYTTPAVAGRPIWGSVLKPGAVWLVGDGAAPTVAFSRDVVVGDAAISAGTYALLAIPSKGDWTTTSSSTETRSSGGPTAAIRRSTSPG